MASVPIAPEEVPSDLADNPIIKFWETMTPQQKQVAEHLAELDRREYLAELERQRAEEHAEP